MSAPIILEHLGARATAGLVDRKGVLAQIRPTLGSAETRVFYFTGAGGIGKTRLLRDVLQRCAPGGEWFTPRLLSMSDVLDLYHTFTHVKEGFAQVVYETLQHRIAEDYGAESLQEYESIFADYRAAHTHFEKSKYNLAGMLKELSLLRDDVARQFLLALGRLSEIYHVVLAIDTAEKLLYETDEIQEALDLREEGLAVLGWLVRDVLPNLKNTTVLIAGRPDPASRRQTLRVDLQAALGERLLIDGLDTFGLQDVRDYFEAVARAVEADGHIDQADRIRLIAADRAEVIWRYTGGRPILLALLIDYLLASSDLIAQVKDSPETARQRSQPELERIQQQIAEELVRYWDEDRSDSNLAVVALAWARKGMDAHLLARVVDLKNADGSWDVRRAQTLLDAVRPLSFIKIRPADARFFLHDELYQMFQEYVLMRVPEPESDRVFKAILQYYAEQVAAARQLIANLGQPRHEKASEFDPVAIGAPKPPDDPSKLAEAVTDLCRLMAEEIHYRLRRSPLEGFQRYYHYAKEAFWASSDDLDMLLRSEILDFLAAHEGEDLIDELPCELIVSDMGLRWIERFQRNARYAVATETANRLREKCAGILNKAGPLAWVRLNQQQGEVLIYTGDLGRAQELLELAINLLQDFQNKKVNLFSSERHKSGEEEVPVMLVATEPAAWLTLIPAPIEGPSEFEAWQYNVLAADTLNDLGYLFRTQGQFRKANVCYERALPFWRELGEKENAANAQYANTLNNLAWACAEIGEFKKAERYCRDALRIRRSLGPSAPVAFSLNTLGLILTRNDDPHAAKVHCERALGTFRDLGQPRGIGLACIALAEVYRRMSDVPDMYSPEESADLLRRAAGHAEEAMRIFTSSVKERPRVVEAFLELGCVYRQWAWLRPAYSVDQEKAVAEPTWQELFDKSRAAFERAIIEAGDDLLHRGVDAQVNLAWLYYYLKNDPQASAEAEKSCKRIDAAYKITETGLPDPTLPQTFFWVQLGKAYLLIGQVAFRRFREGKLSADLVTAAKYYTLSLAYDSLFAADFRDGRRAWDRVYDRLKGLNSRAEFPLIHEGIRSAIREYQLPTPTRIQQLLKEYGLPEMPEDLAA